MAAKDIEYVKVMGWIIDDRPDDWAPNVVAAIKAIPKSSSCGPDWEKKQAFALMERAIAKLQESIKEEDCWERATLVNSAKYYIEMSEKLW